MYSHLPLSPLRLQMFGYGSAPLNEGLGMTSINFRNPEHRDWMSEPMHIGWVVQFQLEAKATFPIRNC